MRRKYPATAVYHTHSLHVRQATRCQRDQQGGLGVVCLCDIRSDAREELRQCPDSGEVGQGIYESFELKLVKVDTSPLKWHRIAAARGAYAKPMLAQQKHEWNAKVVVLASNAEHVWARQVDLLLPGRNASTFPHFWRATICPMGLDRMAGCHALRGTIICDHVATIS